METPENISFISTLLPFILVVFVIAVGVVLLSQQFRQNLYRQKLEQEKLKTTHQIELLRSSIQVQEDERKRIARDLHDELGAVLSILRMHIVQLEQKHTSELSLNENLTKVRSLAENAIANMRRISYELMPPELETFGLTKSLEALVRQMEQSSNMNVNFESDGELDDLDWPVKLAIYRVCMELLNNSIKHAQAHTLTLLFKRQLHEVNFSYQDDGIGLNENSTVGIGLKSMEGRIQALGGLFTFGNAEPKGFRANISIRV